MIIKCHSPYAYLRERLVFTYIVCFHDIPNFFLVFSVFPSYRVQKFFFLKLSQISKSFSNILKKNVYKWTCTVQTYVVEESTVYVYHILLLYTINICDFYFENYIK